MSNCYQAEQSRRIVVVILFQDLVRQPDAVNLPAALRRSGAWGVIEVFIERFQKAEIGLEHSRFQVLLRNFLAVRRGVGAEHDAVLVILEELARASRLAAQLAEPRADLHAQIGIPVEPSRYFI